MKITAGTWEPAVVVATVREAVNAYVDVLVTEGRAAQNLTKYRQVLGRVVSLAEARKTTSLAGLDLPFLDACKKLPTLEKAGPQTKYTECVFLR